MKVHHVPASTVLGEGAVETHIYPQRKGRSVFPTTEPAPTITGKGMNLIGLHVNRQFDPDSRCDFPLGEPSPTVTTKDPRGLLSAGRHRMLTVQETAALMTFPPDYRWPEAIRAARRMVGNAVPPFLARQIAETVKIHLDFKNGR
jgi:site-specific DNA-cytosine methylase